jgi:hypothetical protein
MDKNVISFANDSYFCRALGDLAPPGPGYSDTLKLSNCSDCTVEASAILGGDEDCIDINRGYNIHVRAGRLTSGGKYIATVKGGADMVYLSGCIDRHGSETDIDLGNWSDQASDRTKRVHLNLTTHDGSPVRVRVLHGWKPLICNPSQAYTIDTRFKGIFRWAYAALKWLGLA